MSVTDPVADFLTGIRNALRAKHRKVDVPASRMKAELAKVLLRERYINNFKLIDDQRQGVLRVYLKYATDERSVISGLRRISTPGRRVYVAKEHLLFPWSKSANVTVGEAVKFFPEKNKIYILDDDGKEHKATIVKVSMKGSG